MELLKKMNNISTYSIGLILKSALVIAILISFYIFLSVVVFNDATHKPIYNTWQFPMLFALFFEMHYGL
jgi:hypothetical protein